jgi:hypothetical protein
MKKLFICLILVACGRAPVEFSLKDCTVNNDALIYCSDGSTYQATNKSSGFYGTCNFDKVNGDTLVSCQDGSNALVEN